MFSLPDFARRLLLPVAGLVAVAIALGLFVTWQPAYQVDSKFRDLVEAAQDRDWDDVTDLMAPEYKDRWGFDRERVVRESREALSQFFALEIKAERPVMEVAEGKATVVATLRIKGSGTVVAEYIESEVNTWEDPFTFEWRRMSWKPWDWKLVRVDHPRVDPAQYGVSP